MRKKLLLPQNPVKFLSTVVPSVHPHLHTYAEVFRLSSLSVLPVNLLLV